MLSAILTGLFLLPASASAQRPSADYYDRLQEDCVRRASRSCCMTSVKRMRAHGWRLAPGRNLREHGCPEGFEPDMLKCKDSYRWCRPAGKTSAGTRPGPEEKAGPADGGGASEHMIDVGDSGWRVTVPNGFRLISSKKGRLTWRRMVRRRRDRYDQEEISLQTMQLKPRDMKHRLAACDMRGELIEGSHYGKPTRSYVCQGAPWVNHAYEVVYGTDESYFGLMSRVIVLGYMHWPAYSEGPTPGLPTVRSGSDAPGLKIFRQMQGTLAPKDPEVKGGLSEDEPASSRKVPLLR